METILNETYTYLRYVENNPFPDNDCKLVFLKVLKKLGDLFSFASERLRNDEQLILIVVKQYPDALEHTSEELRSNYEFAKKIVRLKLFSPILTSPLKYLEKFNDEFEIVWEAIHQSLNALGEASIRLRKEKQVFTQAVKNYGAALKFVPKMMIDRELVLIAVSTYGDALQYAMEMNNDKEIVLTALKENPYSFRFASNELKNDREFCFELVKFWKGACFFQFTEQLRNDKHIVLEVAKQAPDLFYHFSKKMKSDREIASIALKSDISSYIYVSDDLKNDREFLSSCMITGSRVFSFINSSETPLISSNRDFILELIENNTNYYYNFFEAKDEVQSDEEMCLKLIKIDPSCFEFTTCENIKNNRELLIKALPFNQYILKNTSDELRNDREIIQLAIRIHEKSLQYASDFLKNDKELVMEAILCDANNLEFASEELRNDRQVVESAILRNGSLIEFASETLRNDRELFLLAIRHSKSEIQIQHLSDKLIQDREILLEYIKRIGGFCNIPESFSDDRELVLLSIQEWGANFEHASYELRNCDRELLLIAIKSGCPLEHVDKRLFDSEIIYEAVKCNSDALYHVPDEFRDNEKIIYFSALRDGWDGLQHASDRLRNDKEFIRKIVKKNRNGLFHVSEEILNDREIVYDAVTCDGKSLRYASETLRDDREIVLQAIKEDGSALIYASKRLSQDRELILLATRNGLDFGEFDRFFLQDREIALQAVIYNGFTLKFLPYDFKMDREIVLEAIKSNESVIVYSLYDFRNDRDFVSQSQLSLSNVVLKLRNDRELVLESLGRPKIITNIVPIYGKVIQTITFKESSLMYASDELKDEFKFNREIMLHAIENGPIAFIYACEELQNDEGFVLESVQRNGMVLKYLPSKFKQDRNIVNNAVQQNGMSLQYAAIELLNDREIVYNAVKNNVLSLEMASFELRNNKQFILDIIQYNYLALNFATKELRSDEQVISQAMENDIEALLFASYLLRHNLDFLKRMNKEDRIVKKASITLQLSINMRGLLEMDESDPDKFDKELDFYISKLENQ